MRQRKEDVRNFALIAGSGLLGAVAALVGVSLMGSAAEVQDPPAPVWKWERTDANPSRYRAEISYRLMRERPAELNRAWRSEFRLNQAFLERSRAVAESRARLEAAVAEATAQHAKGGRSSGLEAELQAELQAELYARLETLQAQLESSFRDLEGTVTRVQVRASDPGAAPVVYVDGVRWDGAMEDLSPDDIESVDVIKGDAAIERYGKEGENGVIIIKKRKPGKKRKGGP
ncbi:MAG: TonB-dependent receptor plug domain-containing protein [Gemmatimonadetes bacterium]|nr:TonB-dependent receptor plug domain-containing protein [Gemmatimonadota bacterium]MYE70243.1 TonB-dependent receptor plug domain-containing protein [Gemmatimonadota bacterium]MYJ69180.1 TonB-dependent receptor plug domain-containing protein [Gemmatimonadota bacterium]